MDWLRTSATKDARTCHRVVIFELVSLFDHVTRGRTSFVFVLLRFGSTVESFAVWRPRMEVSDLQHDGNHGERCKAIRICTTESGRGGQEAG